MRKKINKVVLMSIVALASNQVHAIDMLHYEKPGFEKCTGIVKKGMNDCANHRHACGGVGQTDGLPDEWVFVPTGLCKKIMNGKIYDPDKDKTQS
ncbi:MAG: hypothetical protein LEGION0398_MBIBDBAK_00694 [Legionellaceae bacterium]